MNILGWSKVEISYMPFVKWWTFVVIVAIGGAAIIGWLVGHDLLYTYFDGHVSMKYKTAMAAILSALVVIANRRWRRWPVLALFGLLSSLVVRYIELQVGLIMPVPTDQVQTVFHNFPSLFTIAIFGLFLYCTQCADCAVRGGTWILCISILAFLGHVLEWPLLYGYYEGVSTGMAVPTAVVGLHLGAWMRNTKSRAMQEYKFNRERKTRDRMQVVSEKHHAVVA